MQYTVIDTHSHILPYMDDGAKDPEMSVAMLSQLNSQGVGEVFATPHFLIENESVESFLKRRDAAYGALLQYAKDNQTQHLPDIRLGAEIRVFRGICDADLGSLAIKDTNALLLELPMEKLSKQIIKEIQILCDNTYRIPIIAHLDRYTWFDRSDINALCELPDVVFQFTTKSLSAFAVRRMISKIQKMGCRVIFGSDCHNTSERAPDFCNLTGKGGRASVSRHFGERCLRAHEESCEFILSQSSGDNNGLIF